MASAVAVAPCALRGKVSLPARPARAQRVLVRAAAGRLDVQVRWGVSEGRRRGWEAGA